MPNLFPDRTVFPNSIAKLMNGLVKKNGTMMVKKEDIRHVYCPEVFVRGSWIGNVSDLFESTGVHRNTLKTVSECTYLRIEANAISDIFMKNPGLFVALGSEFVL
ncbi:hypothetical protein TrVE_jg10815 [Triparma verrucosa]|uniref:Uncharacterized protein n=1 Tax=Triparma verrucosa TaxID=1606542 RepID=A0A9W7BLX0_9STRA|nr:hypothetical protein TrVE_jg10815 [Triparma verrucosa]